MFSLCGGLCEWATNVVAAIATGESPEDAIWVTHLPHHLGINRTLFLAQQINGDLSRQQVKKELMQGCKARQQIDPALHGENMVSTDGLAIYDNWCRAAVDVTHFGGQLYLAMLDCGPSRVVIWQQLQTESAIHIVSK